jgi:hypothetical protein
MLAPRAQDDLLAGSTKPPSEVRADRAGTHHQYFHRLLTAPKVR